jgi:thioredoxin-like negative regulator of GroEL
VFTTPWCATCDPVVDRLRAADPASRVVKLDATVERKLADALGVRSAPTTVLAGIDGVVRAQLVGPSAVGDYLDATI